jgi:hypothetical protein
MAKVYIRDGDPEQRIGWKCPGCKDLHAIPTVGPKAWKWNGSLDRPTLEPSINQWSEEYKDDEIHIPKQICHSYLRNGSMQFLNDCTHSLAGQTIELPELDPNWKY